MNHPEFERLAGLAFEEGASRSELERLEALIAANPELRGRWADLLAARAGLTGAALEPMPAGLHEALIGTAFTEGRQERERGSWLSFMTAAIQVRPAFALGGAVAAGLAIGVIGLGLIMGGFRSGRDLGPATTASLPPGPAAVSSTALDQGGAHVELSARREGGETIVRLEARDGTPARVTLAWDPGASRLVGIRWESPVPPSFDPAPGRVVLPIPAAAGIELSFVEIAEGGSAVRVTLSAAGGDREATLLMPP